MQNAKCKNLSGLCGLSGLGGHYGLSGHNVHQVHFILQFAICILHFAFVLLPARFGDAWNKAVQGHFTEGQTRKTELAEIPT